MSDATLFALQQEASEDMSARDQRKPVPEQSQKDDSGSEQQMAGSVLQPVEQQVTTGDVAQVDQPPQVLPADPDQVATSDPAEGEKSHQESISVGEQAEPLAETDPGELKGSTNKSDREGNTTLSTEMEIDRTNVVPKDPAVNANQRSGNELEGIPPSGETGVPVLGSSQTGPGEASVQAETEMNIEESRERPDAGQGDKKASHSQDVTFEPKDNTEAEKEATGTDQSVGSPQKPKTDEDVHTPDMAVGSPLAQPASTSAAATLASSIAPRQIASEYMCTEISSTSEDPMEASSLAIQGATDREDAESEDSNMIASTTGPAEGGETVEHTDPEESTSTKSDEPQDKPRKESSPDFGFRIVNICSLADDSVAEKPKGKKESELSQSKEKDAIKDMSKEVVTHDKEAQSVSEAQTTVTPPKKKMMSRDGWQCRYCSFTSVNYQQMVDHLDSGHSMDHWYACPYCPFGCSRQRSNMYRHIRRSHPKEPDNVAISIIDQDKYFVKATVEVEVESETDEPSAAGGKTSETETETDRPSLPTSHPTVIQKTVKVQAVKPTAHVAPAVQGVRDHHANPPAEGGRLPHIPQPSYPSDTTAATESATPAEDAEDRASDATTAEYRESPPPDAEEASCKTSMHSDEKTQPSDDKPADSAEQQPKPTEEVSDLPKDKPPVSGDDNTGSQVTRKPPPLIPLGIVAASRTQERRRLSQVPPLLRAPVCSASAVLSYAQSRQSALPRTSQAPLSGLSSTAVVTGQSDSVRQVKEAAIKPTTRAPPPVSQQDDDDDSEAARQAFSIFNLSSRMRGPQHFPRQVAPHAPRLPASATGHSSSVAMATRPQVKRPAPAHTSPSDSGSTSDFDPFRQFQIRGPRAPAPSSTALRPTRQEETVVASRVPNRPPPSYAESHRLVRGMGMQSAQPGMGARPPGVIRQPPSMVCSQCGTRVRDADTLQEHMMSRHNYHIQWTCPYCPMPNQMSKSFVEKHIQNCHPGCDIVYIPFRR